MAELIGGSGYDDVQETEPSNPKIGDTWLDTNPNGDADSVGKIYADLGNGADWQILPVQDELQGGRTRELLMLLQDKPLPYVQDPLNLQSDLSGSVQQDGSDYISDSGFTATVAETLTDVVNAEFERGLAFNTNVSGTIVEARIGDNTSGVTNIYLRDTSGNLLDSKTVSDPAVGTWVSFDYSVNADTTYLFKADNGGSTFDQGKTNGDFPYNGELLDITGFATNGNFIQDTGDVQIFDAIRLKRGPSGKVTDRYSSPTTEPADFKQWHVIQARDVTTGGSTSANPVEFEILDSSDTVLNSTRIPLERIADEPFTMRNRVYSENAGSDGQSDYQIATTGDGGHFGIPILTVVSVKQNGSVLDSANWSFDGTDTVTIDTSNVSIASGDTIDIKYDFDVFDSTLQPRAYLNRESTSETSPSISHFRYEYVI